MRVSFTDTYTTNSEVFATFVKLRAKCTLVVDERGSFPLGLAIFFLLVVGQDRI
jgi:hypothetical protein